MLLSEFLYNLAIQEGFPSMTQTLDAIEDINLFNNYVRTKFCIAKNTRSKRQMENQKYRQQFTDLAIAAKELLKREGKILEKFHTQISKSHEQ